jgi:hypothetical protein
MRGLLREAGDTLPSVTAGLAPRATSYDVRRCGCSSLETGRGRRHDLASGRRQRTGRKETGPMNHYPIPVEVEALRFAHEHLRELRREAARQRMAAAATRPGRARARPVALLSSIRAALGAMDRRFEPTVF